MGDGKRVRYLSGEIPGMELVLSSGDGMRLPLHTHVSSHVVLLVGQGCVRVAAMGGSASLRAGEHLALPPHCPHGLTAVGPFAMLCFCLDATMLAPDDRRIPAALAAMAAEGHIRERERGVLLRALADMSPREEPDDALRALKERLVGNPDTEMNLADMASFAHVGKYHLIRMFKKRYGLTPHGFLMQNRVRKARKVLPGNASLTRAALSAGFYDQSHFIRHFKRLHGVTPRQYLASRGLLPPLRRVQQSGGMNLANSSNPSSPASTE